MHLESTGLPPAIHNPAPARGGGAWTSPRRGGENADATNVITPRQTRLFSAPTLAAFHRAIAARVADVRLAIEGSEPAILVPTRAAADQLRRTLRELGASGRDATVRPAILSRGDWYDWLQKHAAKPVHLLTQIEREVLGGLAARDASAAGSPPPFRLRPGIVAVFLAFYDELRRRQRTVETFERLLVGDLEPSADIDRGARRLLEQTRFLVATFRAYERRLDMADGVDEHRLRDHLRETGTHEPVPEVIVTVPDQAGHPAGLYPADFDLLARLPRLARVTIVATDATLESGFRERLEYLLPEIEEQRVAADTLVAPRLVVPGDGGGDRPYFIWRDREEELRGIARSVDRERNGDAPISAGVVVARPLPYLYLAPPVFAESGLRSRAADGLPLAAEPYAAAVDLVLQYAAGDRSATTMSLFRNPHFAFEEQGVADAEFPSLQEPRPLAEHVATLRAFLQRHAAPRSDTPDAIDERTARSRALIHEGLDALEKAHRRLNQGGADVAVADLMTTVRRWIESRTYPPDRSRARNADVHLVDPHAAAYGRFDQVFLAGLTEAEWPPRAGRNIFYPAGMLTGLGWPAERDRLHAARALFRDLLSLARDRVQLSTFLLEDDAVVTVSPMLEDLDADLLDRIAAPGDAEVGRPDAPPPGADAAAGRWHAFRLDRAATGAARERLRGDIGPQSPRRYAVSALERYLDCPFKYFARHTLRLQQEDDDEQMKTALERGRFLHKVFEQFFAEWQDDGHGAIALDTFDIALERFASVAERQLDLLPEAERAVARAWLFGSPASPGLAERLFSREAEDPTAVIIGRLTEHRISNTFELGPPSGRRRVALEGVADRIDLHADGTLTVVDYKTGRAPDRSRALQLPLYARCAERELRGYRGRDWRAGDGMYVAFGESRLTVPMAGKEGVVAAMDRGEAQAVAAVAGIEAGKCPPRPAELFRCTMCPYQTVCRKDYVEDL